MCKKILSISIAAYQVEKTIEECLDSFLTSKYLSELELLVINDGSNDKTVEIVKKYEQKYPQIIKLVNKENGGHGSTINKSLELATGKFFKVIDGDDWVDVNALDCLIEVLKNTTVDLIINSYCEIYPNKERVIAKYQEFEQGKIYDFSDVFHKSNMRKKVIVMHETTILTERLRAVGMHILEKCFYADTYFTYYVGLAARTVMFHNSCVYQYRLGCEGQSVSAIGVYKHIEDLIKVQQGLIDNYFNLSHETMESERLKYLVRILNNAYTTMCCWYVDMISQANKDYLLIEFINKLKREHLALMNEFDLSINNRLISTNPNLFIPLIRWTKQCKIKKWLTHHI